MTSFVSQIFAKVVFEYNLIKSDSRNSNFHFEILANSYFYKDILFRGTVIIAYQNHNSPQLINRKTHKH